MRSFRVTTAVWSFARVGDAADKRGVRNDRIGAFASVGPIADPLNMFTKMAAAANGIEAGVLARHIFGNSDRFTLVLDTFALRDDGRLGVAKESKTQPQEQKLHPLVVARAFGSSNAL